MTGLARVRREAGCTVQECAALLRVSPSTYRRLEAGTLRGGRDPIGIRQPLARLFAAKLGRPVSAQWDLCGDGRHTPTTGPLAIVPRLPLATGGLAGPCAAGTIASSDSGRAVERASAPTR